MKIANDDQYYCGYLDLVNQSTRYGLFRLVEKQAAGRFYRIIADTASRKALHPFPGA